MRGMIVMALASLAVPVAFLSPFLGLLAYCWLSYMRPQDMAWGVGHITFGMYTAVALILGLVVRLKADVFRFNRVTIAMLALWAHWCITTATAFDTDTAADGLVKISSIFLIGLVATGLCTTRSKVKWFAFAIAGSLAFHGTKKGLVGVLSGGARDLNAIGGMMSGNNENGVALNVALPFLIVWAMEETRRWRRAALWASAALTAVAIICTYSRGSFLALAVSIGVLAWRSRSRLLAFGLVLPTAAGLFLMFAPDAFLDRVSGIDTAASTDLSAIYRLKAWGLAWDIGTLHPLTGIGAKNFAEQSYEFMRPVGMPHMEIHSTYFEFIASFGFVGLALYLVFLGCAFSATNKVIRGVKERGDARLRTHANLATAVQAALASYVVSSAFGSLAHFDLPYHVAILGACIGTAMKDDIRVFHAEDTDRAIARVTELAARPVPAADAECSGTEHPSFAARYAAVAAAMPGTHAEAAAPTAAERPAGAAGARDVAVEQPNGSRRTQRTGGDDIAAAMAAKVRPVLRHTTPGNRGGDVVAEESTLELEDLFIDPNGTVCAYAATPRERGIDAERSDSQTWLGLERHARVVRAEVPAPAVAEGAPYLSPIELRKLAAGRPTRGRVPPARPAQR